MDTGTRDATVQTDANGLPQGTPQGSGTDASGDLLSRFDEIINRRLAEARSGIAQEAADTAFRNSQRLIDQRFNRIDPMLAQIPNLVQSQQRIEGHFQTAQEADLDPADRRDREYQRQLQALAQREQDARINAWQTKAYADVIDSLNDAGLKRNDPRLNWQMVDYRQDPQGWLSSMSQQVQRLAIEDARNQYAPPARETRERETRTDNRESPEDRRLRQLEEQNRVIQANARRDAAPRLDTATPNGARRSPMEALETLRQTDVKAWAKEVQRLGKAAGRGALKSWDDVNLNG